MDPVLEPMADFFASRVGDYDRHMLSEVPGCRAGYEKTAASLLAGTRTLLDLGCGTGLELEGIFSRFPEVAVTGIDLSGEMLEKLTAKYPGKNLTLLCGSYFTVPFGENRFDAVVSFQSLHHFSPEKKRELYRKIYRALKDGGCFLDCDYMVETDAEEAFWFAENARLRAERGIPEEAFYHFDTPLTVRHERALLLESGFQKAEKLFREENTTLIRCLKG